MDLDLEFGDSEIPFELDENGRDFKETGEVDYDAINDETFGVEVGEVVDLEDFANQNLISKSLARLAGAKTIDEIELEQLKLASVNATPQPSIWNASMLTLSPTTSTVLPASIQTVPITAEELERKILLEAANLSMSPSTRLPPPIHPQAFAQLQQQMKEPPPGLQPNQLNLFARPPPGFFMPPIPPPGLPGSMPSGLPGGLPPPFPFPPNMPLPPNLPPLNQLPFVPPALLLRGIPPPNLRQIRPKRKEGMPSVRTISDFACDPFAGFMSKKEREWLIKIQIIQCLGTGDPLEDDYYYTRWKRNRVLEQLPDKKGPKERPRYYNFEDAYPSNYTMPTFSGSLGKPSLSTTSFPRPMIEVHADACEEEDQKNAQSSSSQKKLRAILMQIENASMMLLECEFIRNRLAKVEPAEVTEIEASLCTKVEILMTTVVTEEILPMFMVIQKGRHFLSRLIEFSDLHSRQIVIKMIFDTVPKFSKKLDSKAESGTLLASISMAIAQLKPEEFPAFFEPWKMSQIISSLSLSFMQQLIVAILVGIAKILHICLSGNKCNFCRWLVSRSPFTAKLTSDIKEAFQRDDLMKIRSWLNSKFAQPGNLAQFLVHSISELI